MNKLLWIVLGTGILFWQACSCPPSEQTGELGLGPAARDFLSYDGSETLTFRNADGEELRFTAPEGRLLTSSELCYRTTCTEAQFGSRSSCEFFLSESERFTFFNSDNTVAIDLLLYSDVYDYGTADFYDALQVSFSFGSPSIVAIHLLEKRFQWTFDPATLELDAVFEEQASLTLVDQTFTNVLSYEEGSLGVYIKPELGLIGFRTADQSWVIQN